MARTFPFNVASHLDTPVVGVSVGFAVLSFWLKLNGHGTTEQTLFGSYNVSTGQLVRLSDVSPGKISSFWIDPAATGHEALSNTTVSVGVWHHVCCVYSSQIATVYLDGVAGTPVGPFGLKTTTANKWRLGLRLAGTVPADANMAEVAYWLDGTISQAQVTALAKGAPVLWMMRNGDIRQPYAYWPLLGSFDNGINYTPGTGSWAALSTSGTVATANHAPVTRLCPGY